MKAYTTCPLDCFDGCSVVFEAEKPLKGDKTHPITQGYLCPHLNHWFSHPRLETPTLKGKAVSKEEAFAFLVEKLNTTPPSKVLFYKGSGNLGLMQGVAKLFFAKFGAVIATGSLCDESGGWGVEKGRGVNLPLSPLHVKEAEVVVLWGRNPAVTNSHMLPALKGKTVVVIDPVKTMEHAHLHLPLRPRGDLYLALLLSRIAYMEMLEDKGFIAERTEGFEEFKELFLWTPIKKLAALCDVSLDDAATLLSLLKGKKVAILVGTGVQRYRHGHEVLRAIDSFAAMMGWLGKRGCGVGYLSQSGAGYVAPFAVEAKNDSVVNVDFSQYEVVVVQGANPATQMPNSELVRQRLARVPHLVYMGLHENSTSALAELVLPAKSFLEKEDVKVSYGHGFVGKMPQLVWCEQGWSEYGLTKALHEAFGFEGLKTEREYIEAFVASGAVEEERRLVSKLTQGWPYEEKFYTPSGKFLFLDEVEEGFDNEEMWLVFAKWPRALNSQFEPHDCLHVPLCLGLEEGQSIRLKSRYGQCVYAVRPDARLRKDTFLLYSGAQHANALTPPHVSDEGHSPVFQEMVVEWERV